MKIQIASDLHLEFGTPLKTKFQILPDVDVLVLAGDLHTKPESLRKFLNRLRRNYPDVEIIAVPGNHEYYGHEFFQTRQNLKELFVPLAKVSWLDQDVVNIGDVRFVGCTLYSDLSNPLHAHDAKGGITDFRVVRVARNGTESSMTPAFWTEEHQRCRQFLEQALQRSCNAGQKTVVVTHFLPSWSLIRESFKGDKLNAAFAVEVSGLMLEYKPALWIYGHDHNARNDQIIGDTRCVCNQAGYFFEGLEYEPFVVEV